MRELGAICGRYVTHNTLDRRDLVHELGRGAIGGDLPGDRSDATSTAGSLACAPSPSGRPHHREPCVSADNRACHADNLTRQRNIVMFLTIGALALPRSRSVTRHVTGAVASRDHHRHRDQHRIATMLKTGELRAGAIGDYAALGPESRRGREARPAPPRGARPPPRGARGSRGSQGCPPRSPWRSARPAVARPAACLAHGFERHAAPAARRVPLPHRNVRGKSRDHLYLHVLGKAPLNGM